MDSRHLDHVSIVIKPINDFTNDVKWDLQLVQYDVQNFRVNLDDEKKAVELLFI